MNLLKLLNENISKINIDLSANFSEFFPIFIIGAPRSGTTLIYQAMVSIFDVGYPSNLIARFWDNPVIGYAVQTDIFPSNANFVSSFTSANGYSENNALEPHEFGFFWSRWFDHSGSHYTPQTEKIDNRLKQEINSLLILSQKNWVFKNLTLGLKIPLLKQLFTSSKFIIVKRNPHDTAASLLKGRLEIFHSVKEWWSLKPKEIKKIRKLSPYEQVVAQVYYTYKQIDADLTRLSLNDYFIVDYEYFCEKPNEISSDIANKFNLEIVNNIPDFFECRRSDPVEKIQRFLEKYF